MRCQDTAKYQLSRGRQSFVRSDASCRTQLVHVHAQPACKMTHDRIQSALGHVVEMQTWCSPFVKLAEITDVRIYFLLLLIRLRPRLLLGLILLGLNDGRFRRR